MPNHVENELRVSGPKADRDKFRALPFDANTFIPYPAHFRELDEAATEWDERAAKDPTLYQREQRPKDGFNSGGHEWCVHHWGTKWGMYCVVARHNAARLRYDFDSAWDPPLPVVLAMSKEFPSLTFELRYFERGAGFKGELTAKGGEILHENQEHYSGPRGG
ncbi:MAG: hypothetical protein KGJ13_11020 [Patescibacteria group bacterium]|nr:hypothetical protein [Patescibacteria group bacterium]